MPYVNNWSRPVVLGAFDTSLPLDLPNGGYRLSITDSLNEPTRWEILDAVLASGTATLTRGREGTLAQAWPDGSVIYSAVTAGQLNGFEQRITQLENNSGGGGGGGEFGPWVALTAEVGWLVDRLEYRLEPGGIIRFQFAVYVEDAEQPLTPLAWLPETLQLGQGASEGGFEYSGASGYRHSAGDGGPVINAQLVIYQPYLDGKLAIKLVTPGSDWYFAGDSFYGSVAIAL